KACTDDNGPPAFTDDTFTCTITVTNDGPATGSTAHNVVVTDSFSGGEFCIANCPPYPAVNIPANGNLVITTQVQMPPTAGTACDTANATQDAPGPANVADPDDQVCTQVQSKFPHINGFAKDTGQTPTNPDGSLNNNFTFTFGNIFLCKPLGG